MCVLVWLFSCTPGMYPDLWEEWWRPACVLDMQPDMWSTRCRRTSVRSHVKRHTGCHQPEADWLIRCHPELVQIHGFRSVEVLLDTPPGSPKNCPEARGGSVRVHISLSRPISFFMVKPRFCPSRDQFSPVHSSRLLGFGQVLSDQPAASHLEHCMHPDMWEEWWRPACVLDMQPDMWSTRCRRASVRSHAKRHTGCHQPEADWLVSPINTP
ncbi:hypothetical protein F2Q69_00031921 [Brassica cretica]|uniref:Uncharacterized protein n=1 Tax=Brassica cretica TaxID=69181 RepID=A0A8S9S2L1_BRACR|nr:hypothetical protein F2Q69_00031921 [Brassica cretica]